MTAIRILIPLFLLAATALSGCADSSTKPVPSIEERTARAPLPGHYNYTWHMVLGAGAGSGFSTGAESDFIQVPEGVNSIDAYANWTCPVAPACEARIRLSNPEDEDFWHAINGTSPLHLQVQDPVPGEWHVVITRSHNPSVTYEAKGTLQLVVCCVEHPDDGH